MNFTRIFLDVREMEHDVPVMQQHDVNPADELGCLPITIFTKLVRMFFRPIQMLTESSDSGVFETEYYFG